MRAAIRKVISLDFGPFGGRAANDRFGTPTADLTGSALLVTRDKLSLQWASRWLQQTGLEVNVVSDIDAALAAISEMPPTVVITDAGLKDQGNIPFLQTLRKMLGNEYPVIALCDGDLDVGVATDCRATEIARRPFEWDLISQRVIRTVRASETLAQLRLAKARLHKISSDVSEAQRARARQAGMDRVTELPNLGKFRKLLRKVTAANSHGDAKLCLLVIGVDRFRLVNEAVGYQNGNELLRQFADRLRECLRDRDVIGDAASGSITAIAGRLGGARFGLLVSNGDEAQIGRVYKAITARLAEAFEVGGQSIYLTASIGAAIYPTDSGNADELLHHAENAMFDAQSIGSGFEFYRDLHHKGSHQVLAMDRMLREAIRNNELSLSYQPIMNTKTGDVVAAEALLRWQHPEQGNISPGVFVPIAESTGLMAEIGEFVVNTACRQLGLWIAAKKQPIRMAVNLSLCQLLRGDVVATIEKALSDNGIAPEFLEIELSERGVLTQSPAVIAVIQRLKKLGVRISSDDFGTGQAAIGYLKDLPIDVIKIDRSYISGDDRNDRDAAIASGMVALADRLDAIVITEGVESREQLALARDWGASECQGFYFSPAVPADEFEHSFLSERRI